LTSYLENHDLGKAVDWNKLDKNPCDKVQGPTLPPGRKRFLTPEELRAILDHCDEWLRGLVLVLVLTGLRRSELLKLRWRDVDLKHETLTLGVTKNGDDRIVDISPLALPVFEAIERKNADDMVFPDVVPGELSRGFKKACKAAGVTDVHLHDCRRTCGSWLRLSGAKLETIADCLGHRDLKMTRIYARVDRGYLKDALSERDRVFGGELRLVATKTAVA